MSNEVSSAVVYAVIGFREPRYPIVSKPLGNVAAVFAPNMDDLNKVCYCVYASECVEGIFNLRFFILIFPGAYQVYGYFRTRSQSS